ncbi:MAG: hypothetical protein E6Q25_05510 [Acinetobacter sp.]|nr:MAG: hypothetical protein E6Q25_05510 [Acinetobacter sp.]
MRLLDLHQPIIWQTCLSTAFMQHMGQYVYVVEQHGQPCIVKFVSDTASIQLQQSFTHELQQYIRFQRQDFCPHFQIEHAQRFRQIHSPVSIASAMLILPYYTTLSKQMIQAMPLDKKIIIFRKICHAVHDVHELGWLHADLKIQHFVMDQEQIKLLDFAQMSRIGDSSDLTLNATPAYMAPELFLGEKVSVQSDIYALGVIFFELLMQEKPFMARNYQSWAGQHCQKAVPLLDHSYLIYQNVLDAMLAKHKKNRFSTMNQLIIALNLIKKS